MLFFLEKKQYMQRYKNSKTNSFEKKMIFLFEEILDKNKFLNLS